MHDFADTARRALTATRAGAKVLIVRNTVGHAVSTQQALEEFAVRPATRVCCSTSRGSPNPPSRAIRRL